MAAEVTKLISRKAVLAIFGGAVALLLLWTVWKSDTVQRIAQPEKYWNSRIVLAELQVERLRDKALQCTSAVSRLREGAMNKDAGTAPGSAAQDLNRLCESYSEEIRRAVDDALAAREGLRKSRS